MTAIETTGLRPHRRPRTDLGRYPPPHPRAAGGGRGDRHRPLVGRLAHRRQVGPLRRRPLGRRPPHRRGPGAALDLSAARRRPELFVAGECLAEGPRQTLQTMLHEAVHALAHARGVKDTSRGGKYHNKREFVALAGELGQPGQTASDPIR